MKGLNVRYKAKYVQKGEKRQKCTGVANISRFQEGEQYHFLKGWVEVGLALVIALLFAHIFAPD